MAPQHTISEELQQAASQWRVDGLSDEVIIEGASEAIADMYSWRGLEGADSPSENMAILNSDTVALRRAIIRNVVGLLIDGKCFQTNEAQRIPLDSEDEAFMTEFLRRAAAHIPEGRTDG